MTALTYSDQSWSGALYRTTPNSLDWAYSFQWNAANYTEFIKKLHWSEKIFLKSRETASYALDWACSFQWNAVNSRELIKKVHWPK